MADRPNIIIVECDELRADTLGYAGHPVVRTPHLDRLAARSCQFSDHHTVSPSCAPSRHAFFTGKYPHSTHTPGGNLPLRAGTQYWPQIMRDAGYATAVVGKLHHTPTRETYGFTDAKITDNFQGSNAHIEWLESQGQDFHRRPPNDPRHLARRERGIRLSWGRDHYPDRYTETAFVANEGVRYLDAPACQPFMLHLSFKRPHDPHFVPEPWDSLYRDAAIEPPHVPEGEVASKPRQLGWMIRRAGWDKITGDEWRDQRAHYFALVTYLDHHIGRILEALDRGGYWENSVVVFTSDHGTALGDHGYYGKFFNYEVSTRVPLIIHFPAQTEGRTITRTNTNIDVMPTVLEHCGVPVPASVQGRRMQPLLEGRDDGWDDRFYMELTGILRNKDNTNPRIHLYRRGLRSGGWKITCHRNTMPGEWDWTTEWELYHLEQDPGELRNLAGDPAHAATLERLKEELLVMQLEKEMDLDLSRYGIGTA